MKKRSANRLAKLIKERRHELGFSIQELGRRSGINIATISRLENAEIPSPHAENLRALAESLDLPVTDVFVCANWIPDGQLPTYQPYFRSKYGGLPADAMDEIETSVARVLEKYGYDGSVPAPGEDEA
ncbi:helix-turn-helix domain-containing protein [Kribbella sp. NPDC056345]|uniref:helix-turn-helix domain-containing protein n=1 Tax=Kribbella sp. NPDC056345 TaxID=3345789 RepID=UPI0035E001D1